MAQLVELILKGGGFDSWSRHMPKMWVRFPGGVVHMIFSLTLMFFFPPPPSKINEKTNISLGED